MFRKAIGKNIEANKKGFRLRGHEVKRIEAFSDAVFAFAVTLLIVSLEVPKNFEELMLIMRGFFAFGISFFLLMMIWYEQNVFFRLYGLDDVITITLNCILIFLVLFYVYPLKFLFTLSFSHQIYGRENSPIQMTQEQFPQLMLIYSGGFIAIYLLFFLMYAHALRKKEMLDLTPTEEFDTKTKMYSHCILIFVGSISILIALIISPERVGFAAMVYLIIAPLFSIFHSYRSRKRKKLFASDVIT